MSRPARPSRSSSSSSARASSASPGIVDQAPNQGFFGLFQLSERRQLPGRDGGPPLDRRLPNLRPDDLFRNPGLVGDPVRELVPGGRIGNPGGHRQHLARGTAAGCRPGRNRRPRPPDRADTPDTAANCAVFHGTVRRPCRRMNVSGSSPLSSTTTLTSKPFGDQQLARPGRGALAGGVGVEAQHDLRREPAQQLRLLRASAPCRRRRPPGAACVWNTCAKSKYPSTSTAKPTLPNLRLRQVQAVERPALRVDRRLGRIQILRPALVGVHLRGRRTR